MSRFFTVSLLISAALIAKPTGLSVKSGSAEVTGSGIRTTDKAILNWKEFSIQKGEVVRFIQPSELSSCLNRVTGSQMSQILGQLESNGKVYLINPQGLFVGPDAVIDTAGFVGSTFDVLDEDYLSGTMNFFGDSSAKIINLGKINCLDGEVSLFAKYVENEGEIVGADVLLKADGIYIKPDGDFDGGLAYGYGVRSSGTVEAIGCEERAGRIYLIAKNAATEVTGDLTAKGGEVRLLGEQVVVEGRSVIDVADGGTVLIGGDYQGSNPDVQNAKNTHVGSEVMIYAQGGQSGDAGRVIVWSDGYADFCGEINVRGGDEGGNGGFVEVSGLKGFSYRGRSDRRAPFGKCGTLLLDPDSNIGISLAATSGMAFAAGVYSPTADTAILNNGDLVAMLGLGDVTITTDNPVGTQTGTIFFSAPVSWPDATKLTVNATSTIGIVSTTISSTFAGANFDALELNANPLGGAVLLGSGIFFELASISTVSGNVVLDGVGGPTGGSQSGIRSVAGGVNVVSTGVGASAGNITLIGEAGGDTTDCVGVRLNDGSAVTSVDGNITITGTCSNTYSSTANVGVLIPDPTKVLSTGTGTVDITGTGGDGTDDNVGVSIIGASTEVGQSGGTGTVTIIGTGRGSGGDNYGITLSSGGSVLGTSDTVTLTGIGASGDDSNIGILVTGLSSDVTTTTGAISMTGTGMGSDSSNSGIVIASSAEVLSSSGGTITMMGTGSASGSSGDNSGIVTSGFTTKIETAGTLSLTGVAGDESGIVLESRAAIVGLSGSEITIDGTGGDEYGVFIDNGTISAVTGEITVIGRDSGGTEKGAILDTGSIIFSSSSAPINVTSLGDLFIFEGSRISAVSGLTTVTVDRDIVIEGNNLAGVGSTGILPETGDVRITAGRDVILRGGSEPSAGAQIGAETAIGFSSSNILLSSVGRDLNILGNRTTGYAVIGHASPTISGFWGGGITAVVGRDINITGASVGGGAEGFAQIGHIDAAGSSLSGNIDLTAARAISITGSPTVATGFARIGHGGQGAGTVTTSTMTVRAGTNLTLTSNVAPAQIENLATTAGSGNLTLVVDNLFPTVPSFGTGAFTLNSDLNATGELRIYTVSPTLNTINDLINGAVFVGGPFNVDSNTEQYGTYFPGGSFGGAVFKIYYKVGGQTQVIIATRIIDEIFVQSVATAELEDRLPNFRYMRLGNYPPYHGDFCQDGVCDPNFDPYGSFIFEDNVYWIGADR